jgi:Tfp pilus assembly protein PilV
MSLRRGQTLIEVVIATLIAAMTTTAMFSVFLSSFYSTTKADRRDAAAMVLKRARETLRSYVSIDPLNSNMINGLPGAPGSTAGLWTSDTSGGWALAAGNHTITSLLSNTPLAGGTFTYTVSNSNCLNMATPTDYNQCKVVLFNLTYPDPAP